MHPRRRFTIFFQFLVALALVAGIAIVGVAQTPREVSPEAKRDTASHKNPRPAPRYSRDKAEAGAGWLILDGQLVPGPYDVIISDSIIKVNGIAVVSVPPPSEKKCADSASIARHQFFSTLNDSFRTWVPAVGFDTACQRTLSLAQSLPEIDSAYMLSESAIRYWIHGDKWGEVMMLEPPREPFQTPEERLQDNLRFLGGRLKMHLTSGSLVIMQQGRHKIVSWPRSKIVLEQLQKIAATIPDLKARTDAVLEIIHDRRYAQVIAERFMQK